MKPRRGFRACWRGGTHPELPAGGLLPKLTHASIRFAGPTGCPLHSWNDRRRNADRPEGHQPVGPMAPRAACRCPAARAGRQCRARGRVVSLAPDVSGPRARCLAITGDGSRGESLPIGTEPVELQPPDVLHSGGEPGGLRYTGTRPRRRSRIRSATKRCIATSAGGSWRCSGSRSMERRTRSSIAWHSTRQASRRPSTVMKSTCRASRTTCSPAPTPPCHG